MKNEIVASAESQLKLLKDRIEKKINFFLPSKTEFPEHLHSAMHYAVLNGGKRLRPMLVYAAGACLGADLEVLDLPAVAVELIHCYSLVHDDLPAMDDDDLRRGLPTCHKAYDEATAILVGDALQSLAFELLAKKRQKPNTAVQLEMLQVLALSSGSKGMVGGQDLDLQAEGKALNLGALENLHSLKTGALIRASVRLGALAAGCTYREALVCLDQYAKAIGLAFQIQDDILDIEGSTQRLGKCVGSDAERQKVTYPMLTCIDEAKAKVKELTQAALTTLDKLPYDTSQLALLCHWMTRRDS